MGTTEESIVYQLLSSIRASELNNDEVITERRIRSFLRTHRAIFISNSTFNGLLVTDTYFQPVELSFTQLNKNEWVSPVPDIIKLPNNFGTKFMTAGFTNIAIVPEENYHLSKKNPINKYVPSAKIENNVLTLRVPELSPYAINPNNLIENCLIKNKERIMLSVILDNVDDGKGYDWTKSQYPVEPEIVQLIKDNILKREFSIILQTKPDQVPNMKNDTLRYHDQDNVQQ